MPVYRWRGGKLSCVFNASSVKDAQRRMGRTVPEHEMRAIDRMVELARSDALRLDMEFAPGDMQLLNNDTTLHWRTEFQDHTERVRKRRLLRSWLSIEDARPLDPLLISGRWPSAEHAAPRPAPPSPARGARRFSLQSGAGRPICRAPVRFIAPA